MLGAQLAGVSAGGARVEERGGGDEELGNSAPQARNSLAQARKPWVVCRNAIEPRRRRHELIKKVFWIVWNSVLFQHRNKFLFKGEFAMMSFLIVNVLDDRRYIG